MLICARGGPSMMRALTTIGSCRFCPLLPPLSSVSWGDRDWVGELGFGSGAGAGDRASQRVICRVPGQGFGDPTFCVGVECGVCVERCPFDVEIITKMREAVALFEAQAA